MRIELQNTGSVIPSGDEFIDQFDNSICYDLNVMNEVALTAFPVF